MLKWAHRYVPLLVPGLRFQYWWTNFEKYAFLIDFYQNMKNSACFAINISLSFQKKCYIPWERRDHELFRTPLTFISRFCLSCLPAIFGWHDLNLIFFNKLPHLIMTGTHSRQNLEIKVKGLLKSSWSPLVDGIYNFFCRLNFQGDIWGQKCWFFNILKKIRPNPTKKSMKMVSVSFLIKFSFAPRPNLTRRTWPQINQTYCLPVPAVFLKKNEDDYWRFFPSWSWCPMCNNMILTHCLPAPPWH